MFLEITCFSSIQKMFALQLDRMWSDEHQKFRSAVNVKKITTPRQLRINLSNLIGLRSAN